MKIATLGCRLVNAKRRSTESNAEPIPGTLGAVLYQGRTAAPPSEADWTRLVQSVGTGDELALHALYDRSHRLVFTLIMRITHNRQSAEELTLDVFHDIWRHATSYEPANGTVLGWILNRARSRALDRLRFDGRQKRTLPEGDTGSLWAAPPEEDAIVVEQRAERLRKALTSLSPDEQAAIETAFFGELTYSEVAARLSQPLGTIKTRIRSGLAKLRSALSREEDT